MKKRLRIAGIVVFLLLIWVPVFQMTLGFYKEFEDAENRELAPPPHWGNSPLSRLAGETEAYLDDHFGFRPDLIRWNCFLKLKLLGESPVRSIVAGTRNWLFYCSEVLADGNTINDHMGTIPLPKIELEKLRVNVEKNHRRFSKRGIFYLLVIAPNKNTIYGEYLPERIASCKSKTRLDQFVEYMARHSDFRFLDLREKLLRAKALYPVYWQTDSHWNSYGAYVGYRQIMRAIGRQYPRAAPVEISGEIEVEHRKRGGDLAQILFLHDIISEDNETSFEIGPAGGDSRFRKLLFRHDSFGDNLYPYLRQHFQKIVNIAPFAPFRFNEIFSDPPDIVVHVFTERYLTQAIHDDFFYKERD